MAPKLKFSDGEKVLCFHGPLLYEAKCIKSQVKDKNVKYFIHYSGWNKNWDEWVPESRVLKFNDANMQKQKELQVAHGKGKKTTKAGKAGAKKEPSDRESTALPPQERISKQKTKEAAAATPSAVVEIASESQRKKRVKAEQNVETEEEYIQKLEIKLKIPDELKVWLVDDWDLVTRQKKIVQLPARVPVENIISDYIESKLNSKTMNDNKESAMRETCNGIREYFNVMLGKQLLYNLERPQYTEIMAKNPDSTPSQLYGAIHVLRLFTKLGAALAYTPLNEDSVAVISHNLNEFQRYLQRSAFQLFSQTDYIEAPPEYIKKAG